MNYKHKMVLVMLFYLDFGWNVDGHVGYNMGLAHIIFNKSNKTLWYVTLSVVWFNTIQDFD